MPNCTTVVQTVSDLTKFAQKNYTFRHFIRLKKLPKSFGIVQLNQIFQIKYSISNFSNQIKSNLFKFQIISNQIESNHFKFQITPNQIKSNQIFEIFDLIYSPAWDQPILDVTINWINLDTLLLVSISLNLAMTKCTTVVQTENDNLLILIRLKKSQIVKHFLVNIRLLLYDLMHQKCEWINPLFYFIFKATPI